MRFRFVLVMHMQPVLSAWWFDDSVRVHIYIYIPVVGPDVLVTGHHRTINFLTVTGRLLNGMENLP
jgi:hypothetical protein